MNRFRRRGIGLIESVLFVVVALGMLIGGIAYYQQTSEATRVNDAIRSIVGIQSGVRSLYQASGSFGSEGENLVPATIASGSISSTLVRADGGLNNQWAGAITVRGYTDGFVIDYAGLPKEACARLSPYTSSGNGAAGIGIAAVLVNGADADLDSDGSVSPAEAASSCSASSALAVKWAFVADASITIDAAQLDDMLERSSEEPVTETGRATQTESTACGEGFSGDQTHTREIISYSDGSTQAGSWTAFDRSACIALPPTETGRQVETETAACGTGFTGNQTRSRDVITYSDGSTVNSDWSAFDRSQCVTQPPTPVASFQLREGFQFMSCDVAGAPGWKITYYGPNYQQWSDGSVTETYNWSVPGNTCSTSNGSANVIKAFKEDCPFGQAKEETWRVNSTKHASGQWFTSTLQLMAAKSACR